jgi:hypothetical protein
MLKPILLLLSGRHVTVDIVRAAVTGSSAGAAESHQRLLAAGFKRIAC